MKPPVPRLRIIAGTDIEMDDGLPFNIKLVPNSANGIEEYRYETKKGRGEILNLSEKIRAKYGFSLFEFDLAYAVNGEGGIFIGKGLRSRLTERQLKLLLLEISSSL